MKNDGVGLMDGLGGMLHRIRWLQLQLRLIRWLRLQLYLIGGLQLVLLENFLILQIINITVVVIVIMQTITVMMLIRC